MMINAINKIQYCEQREGLGRRGIPFVFISTGCYNVFIVLSGLNNRILFLTVVEAMKPRMRGAQHGEVLRRALFLACGEPDAFLPCPHIAEWASELWQCSICKCTNPSRGPHTTTSFKPQYLPKAPSPIPSHQRLELQNTDL